MVLLEKKMGRCVECGLHGPSAAKTLAAEAVGVPGRREDRGLPKIDLGEFNLQPLPTVSPAPPPTVPSGPADLSQQLRQEGGDRLGKGHQARGAQHPCQGWGAPTALSFLRRQRDCQVSPAQNRWLRISGPFTNSPSPEGAD